MPHAIDRATSPATRGLDEGFHTHAWHLDSEGRNYTLDDAIRYYLRGEFSGAFYSVGRVAHLLQDMGVPAHVRNDSHLGLAGDPSDPLEQLIELGDGVKGKWNFNKHRTFGHTGIYTEAIGLSGRLLDLMYTPVETLFYNFAHMTYMGNYSYNTIPGNGNAHHPDEENFKIFKKSDVNDSEFWNKCVVNEQLLWKKIKDLADDAAYRIQQAGYCISQVKESVKEELLTNPERKDLFYAFRSSFQTLRFETENILKEIDNIYGLQMNSISNFRSVINKEILIYDKMNTFCNNYANYDLPGKQPGKNEISDVMRSFMLKIDQLNISQFRTFAETSESVYSAARSWINSFQNEDVLIDFYKGENGPCCLSQDLLEKQSRATEPQAVVFTAALMAQWFERLFKPSTGAGLGVWLNSNPGEAKQTSGLTPGGYLDASPVGSSGDPTNSDDSSPKIELKVLQRFDSGSKSASASKTATIGLANHLPVPIGVTIEIELVQEGTDHDLWESGVEFLVKEIEVIPEKGTVSSSPAGKTFGGTSTRTNQQDKDTIKLSKNNKQSTITIGELYPFSAMGKKLPKMEDLPESVLAPVNKPVSILAPGTGAGFVERENEAQLENADLFPRYDHPDSTLTTLISLDGRYTEPEEKEKEKTQ